MGRVGERREFGGSDIIIFFILKRLLIKFRVCLKKNFPVAYIAMPSLYCARVGGGRMSGRVPHSDKRILELHGKGNARV